jgi:hypothetical protein
VGNFQAENWAVLKREKQKSGQAGNLNSFASHVQEKLAFLERNASSFTHHREYRLDAHEAPPGYQHRSHVVRPASCLTILIS